MERDQGGLIMAMTFDISTHTLTWSVTEKSYIDLERFENFNSHAHVERDNEDLPPF